MTRDQLNEAIRKVAQATQQSVWEVLAKMHREDRRTWSLIREAV